MAPTTRNEEKLKKKATSGENSETLTSEESTTTPATSGTDSSGTTGTTGTSVTQTTQQTSTTEQSAATQATRSIQVDQSGIAATPAASTTTIVPSAAVPDATLMPPPRPAKSVRTRRSKASSKRLLAELEAKERLAELELRRIEAQATLEKIRQEKEAAEDSSQDELEDEVEDLAPQRIQDWFQRRDEDTTARRKEHRPDDCAVAPEPQNAQPRSSATIEVATLSAALTEAIQAAKSTKQYIPDLPTFDGRARDWLQFKATYEETSLSFSTSENVARIRKSLKGVALEAVSALLMSYPRPEDIIAALERRYGRPDALLLEELEKIKTLTRLTENPRDLCIFASRIANTTATISLLKKPQYLHNPEILRHIVEKLTPILKNKWYDYAAANEEMPELQKISCFLNKEADKCAPYAPNEQAHETRPPKKKIERTYGAVQKHEKVPCPLCKSEAHLLPSCPQFTNANVNERWEIAKVNRVCYRCLVSTHRRFLCRARPCGHQGCSMRHHRLLHHEKRTPIEATAAPTTPPPQNEGVVASAVEISAAAVGANRAYLKIVPVVLSGPQAKVNTFALLDEGSTVTIIDAAVADTLGLDGPTQPMWVQGVSGTEISHETSKKVNIEIEGRHGGNSKHRICARTVKRLNFTAQSVKLREIEDCSHLEDLKNEVVYENATPKILLGQDNWELIVSREIRTGRRNQLVASKTLLGWVIHGCRTSNAAPVAYCCATLTQPEHTEDIEEQMKKYFALESLNIEPRKQKSDPEVQALQILEEKSRRLPDGRFETGLLWRESEATAIPNNKVDALRRLYTLERKLDRDEKLKTQYNERIENLLKCNYAEPVSTPPSNRTWFLPHFAVCNPEKPKIRVVHDAAAKSHGRSLNTMLLSGPDLLQSLPGVIMRFRQHRYAVSADIKEMFMQIKIREEDRDALRFLWRGDRREGEPDEYRMTSVIFGATSSPCTALYVKNRNAQEHASEFPNAARAIEKNHYMDDYLQSFDTLEEAKKTAREVDFVHKKAGFQLRGWASNEHEIIRSITERERDGNTVQIGGSDIEKALGLLWNTSDDTIRFRLNTRRAPQEVLQNTRPPTKREALSIIMSIFDPLGLIATITTPAKRIMQDTWRYKTEWDEPIPEELQEKWSEWLKRLHDLGNLKIPRCYNAEPAVRYELHTFVDASEEAYAAATYWRMTSADGTVHIALAAGKSRVTPTKPISIPRLELQAAVLGVRLSRTVASEHDYKISQRIYWSDSRTALAWIRSEPRTYKTFVAHRLAEIEDETKKNEWRWLPSAENVADDATRETPSNFDAQHRWFRGPAFLYEPESAWPRENKVEIPLTGEEKEKCCATNIDYPGKHDHLPQIERFSTWTRLIRATARVLQFIDLCKNRRKVVDPERQLIAAAKRKRTRANAESDSTWVRNQPRKHAFVPTRKVPKKNNEEIKFITLEACLVRAERLWMRAAQEDSYKKERERIMSGRAPEKDDRFIQLSVYIDEYNLIRQRGRIAAADALTEDMACPIVLHGKHYYTRLYMQHIHTKLHHGVTEIVVNELRQRLHIMKIRPSVKEVINRCPVCKLRKAKPAAPSTGDLPAARLAHHARPFTYTGLDYFGPLEVTVGRHREKRHVALFTCMTSRAIHLEVVASLSTDSAINALRRFIARRGAPRELWSDNATAFRGAHRELAEEMKRSSAVQHISWRFLPPASPFMAGAWERMVRTVKNALKTTLQEKSPSEETLQTLLAEVEMTVNSRPLTYVPVGPEDPPALTPNMILLGPGLPSTAPGVFTEEDDHAKQHWRRAQLLADVFWRRWVNEYLPLLQHRREPTSTGTSPAVGDVVLICDPNLPRNTWPRGRITRVYPGQDGVVRVADVTTSRGHVLRRPTKRIVVLPVDSHGDGGRNVNDGIVN